MTRPAVIVACYLGVWKLSGASALDADSTTVELARWDSPFVVLTVTKDPTVQFAKIQRTSAILTLILKGDLGADPSTIEEKISFEIETIKTEWPEERLRQGVFLIADGEIEVNVSLEKCRETPEFSICFDLVDKASVKERFHPFVHSALTGLVLAQRADAERQHQRVDEIVFLKDVETGRIIHSFSIHGSELRLSLGTVLPGEAIKRAGEFAHAIHDSAALSSPLMLLSSSLRHDSEALSAFVSAYTALEMFLKKNFSAEYKSKWLALDPHVPTATTDILKRAHANEMYSVADMFRVIASLLVDAGEAAMDFAEFTRLKKVRNDLFHDGDIPASLPTTKAQTLLFKYAGLHLKPAEGME